jgi:hypothetical protein
VNVNVNVRANAKERDACARQAAFHIDGPRTAQQLRCLIIGHRPSTVDHRPVIATRAGVHDANTLGQGMALLSSGGGGFAPEDSFPLAFLLLE